MHREGRLEEGRAMQVFKEKRGQFEEASGKVSCPASEPKDHAGLAP